MKHSRVRVLVLCAIGWTLAISGLSQNVMGQENLVTFASGPSSSRVFNLDTTFLGLAQSVCLNESFPANCPPGATLYGFNGSGWLADLSDIPDATWIYAPGITGESSPAQFTVYVFATSFVIPGTPTAGALFIAVDDAAKIIVNGRCVGKIGHPTDLGKASDAQNNIHKFDITAFLVAGKNRVRIIQENGCFSQCGVPQNYATNPSGVVYGGSATFVQ